MNDKRTVKQLEQVLAQEQKRADQLQAKLRLETLHSADLLHDLRETRKTLDVARQNNENQVRTINELQAYQDAWLSQKSKLEKEVAELRQKLNLAHDMTRLPPTAEPMKPVKRCVICDHERYHKEGKEHAYCDECGYIEEKPVLNDCGIKTDQGGPGTDNPPQRPFGGKAHCEKCDSRMAWISPGKWHCDKCGYSEEKYVVKTYNGRGVIIFNGKKTCSVCNSPMDFVSPGVWRCGPCSIRAEKEKKPVKPNFESNKEAAYNIVNISARVIAQLAINFARVGDFRTSAYYVERCRQWARDNHKSYESVFGEALKGL